MSLDRGSSSAQRANAGETGSEPTRPGSENQEKLTLAKALKLVRLRHGSKAGIIDTRRRSTWARRAAALKLLQEHREKKPTAPDIDQWHLDAKIREFIAARDEYRVAVNAWAKRERELQQSPAFMHRYTVYSDGSLFRHIHGQGDTLREALTAAGVTFAGGAE